MKPKLARTEAAQPCESSPRSGRGRDMSKIVAKDREPLKRKRAGQPHSVTLRRRSQRRLSNVRNVEVVGSSPSSPTITSTVTSTPVCLVSGAAGQSCFDSVDARGPRGARDNPQSVLRERLSLPHRRWAVKTRTRRSSRGFTRAIGERNGEQLAWHRPQWRVCFERTALARSGEPLEGWCRSQHLHPPPDDLLIGRPQTRQQRP